VSHYLNSGKQGYINFKKGDKNEIFKREDGILQVVSIKLTLLNIFISANEWLFVLQISL